MFNALQFIKQSWVNNLRWLNLLQRNEWVSFRMDGASVHDGIPSAFRYVCQRWLECLGDWASLQILSTHWSLRIVLLFRLFALHAHTEHTRYWVRFGFVFIFLSLCIRSNRPSENLRTPSGTDFYPYFFFPRFSSVFYYFIASIEMNVRWCC